jgi:GTPase SAR1 family protein
MSDSIVSLKPIVHYPRKAEVGKTYLMTIDLQVEDGYDWQTDWHYEEEEYPIYCAVESDLFSSKSIGSPVVVIHRFGGSYGSAKFLLTASREARKGELKVALINAWGVTVKVLPLEQVELTVAYREKYTRTSKSTTQIKSQIKYIPLKVFISYTHDSSEHNDRVIELADRLRNDGIDCNIDQYEQSPAAGWPSWMLVEIDAADIVLVVCTENYNRRFKGKEAYGKGRGLTWEGGVIIQELYESQGNNSKFIPVFFNLEDARYIPKPLASVSSYKLEIANEHDYELLYRRLTDRYTDLQPSLSEARVLSPRKRRQFLFKPKFNNLPHQSYNTFIGREPEIKKLFYRISQNYRPHVNVVIGIGGVGKTALVLEVAYRCFEAKNNPTINQDIPTFDSIIFTSSKATSWSDTHLLNRPIKESTLIDIYRVIAETLNEPSITQVPTEKQQETVYQVLSRRSTLLIVDNMETLSEQDRTNILEFVENVPSSTQVIITTREKIGFSTIPVNSLEDTESRKLIEAQAEYHDIVITSNQKTQIYKRFGGFPLAIIYAVGQRAAGYTFANILKPTVPLPADLGKFLFESSVAPLRGTSAHKLLMTMTYFRDAPCRDALITIAGLVDGTSGVIDGLARLQQLSLIKEEKGSTDRVCYKILPITNQYALNELENNTNQDFKVATEKRWIGWYLKFTKQYGGEDWENWRTRYDRLEEEWRNIQAVLYWCAAQEDWLKVIELWDNIDGYVDLNRHWQKRRHWWKRIYEISDDINIKVKALSEKAWTLILMGNEHHPEAEASLNQSWQLRESVSLIIQADIANHLAILEKGRENYTEAQSWLDREAEILAICQLPERDKNRRKAQNLYYQAQINKLLGNIDLAEQQFNQVIQLCESIGWIRFLNYAQNSLGNILIEKHELEKAKDLIQSGLVVAETMEEIRRIALYHASNAKLYYQLARAEVETDESINQASKYINQAQEYAIQALIVFKKELMREEQEEIEILLMSIEDQITSIEDRTNLR